MQVFVTKYVPRELLDFVTMDIMAVQTIIIYYKRKTLIRICSCMLQLIAFSDIHVVM